MGTDILQIQMLGGFSIRRGSGEIHDGSDRSRKVWLLLAYLIFHRSRTVTLEELANLLWGAQEKSSNPANALKTTLHRARTCLDQLGGGAGHELILRREGGYAWNDAVPVALDAEEFCALCQAGSDAGSEEQKLDCWLRALSLYRGAFLSKLSFEPWVVSIAARCRTLYLQTVLDALPLLEGQARWQETAQLCRTALAAEPDEEELARRLMAALLQLGDDRGAVSVYEATRERFLTEFGVTPGEECTALYREALRTVNDHTTPSGVILKQLRESGETGGPLFCDYDIFKAIYQSVTRSVARSGDAVHLALISAAGKQGGELARHSLDRVMEHLEELIRAGLRRGDVAARCSISQFILLLPQANYENSLMVCERITKAFTRQYPHSPAQLQVSVHPLEPAI